MVYLYRDLSVVEQVSFTLFSHLLFQKIVRRCVFKPTVAPIRVERTGASLPYGPVNRIVACYSHLSGKPLYQRSSRVYLHVLPLVMYPTQRLMRNTVLLTGLAGLGAF